MKATALAALAFLSAGCSQEPEPAASILASQTKTSPRPDPVLGTWVCIADNGGGFKGARMDLRVDGVAVFNYKGMTTRRRYRQEPGSEWMARRRLELGKPGNGLDRLGQNRALDDFERPGVVMVYFQENGHYVDYGGNLLMFIPEIPVLYNLLTQAWCRPGDEKMVAELMSR
jgi:hypothetical protein